MPIQFLNNTRARYSDGTGKPLASGTVGVYTAGTSFGTLASIWDTVTKDVELTNPVTLSSAGEAEIWYEDEVDIQVKNSSGTVVDTALGLNPNASASDAAQDIQAFNLVPNGSFETDATADGAPDSWTIAPYSGSSIANTSDVVTNGTKALEFNTSAAGTGGGIATSTKFPVTEGSVCSVVWSFFATHASTLNTFQIKWYDEDNVHQSTSTLTMPASGSVPTSWTGYTEEVTAHASATQGEVVLTGISSGGSNLSSKAYFDGIMVTNHAGLVNLTGTQTLTNKTLTSPTITTGSLTSPDIDQVVDSNDNEVVIYGEVASAVNEITETNAASGNKPSINQTGDDDVGIDIEGVEIHNGVVTGSLTGNADTVTTNANLTGDVTSVGNATTITTDSVSFSDEILSGTATGSWSIGGAATQLIPVGVYDIRNTNGSGALDIEVFVNSTWTTVATLVNAEGWQCISNGSNIRLLGVTTTQTVYYTEIFG